MVSIRAPRVGSDAPLELPETFSMCFNPRSPCGERQFLLAHRERHTRFNPRSPCGERLLSFTRTTKRPRFNPRSPCGERRAEKYFNVILKPVSIRAPRVGSDPFNDNITHHPSEFQSALPVWGATYSAFASSCVIEVSIRAPRVGSDQAPFQFRKNQNVSIRAPRVGSDATARQCAGYQPRFNPRSPCGERRPRSFFRFLHWDVSIRAPRVGSDGGETRPIR